MSAKSYDLNFSGYWLAQNIAWLPAQSGIYGVYAATYNSINNNVNLNRLIYIGEAENVNARIQGHEKWEQWRRQIRLNEVLCFNSALISPAADRKRSEAAMIYQHKPACNDEYVHNFPFEQTSITTRGSNALMHGYFTVYPTQSLSSLGLYGLGARPRW